MELAFARLCCFPGSLAVTKTSREISLKHLQGRKHKEHISMEHPDTSGNPGSWAWRDSGCKRPTFPEAFREHRKVFVVLRRSSGASRVACKKPCTSVHLLAFADMMPLRS